MSPWQTAKLGQLTTVISSGATPLGGAENYSDDGPVLFIRSQNVLMNELDISGAAHISDVFDRQLARTRVETGDVLLNITGASIGRVAPFLLQGKRANVNQHVCVIRPKPGSLFSGFLSHYIATPQFQAHINRIQAGGTRQALNFAQIADFEIPLPPMEMQRRIAVILDQAEALRTKRRQALAKLDTLTQSLFLEMFGDPIANPKNWRSTMLGDLVEKIESGSSPVCLDRRASHNEWGVLKLGAVTKCVFHPEENKALRDTYPSRHLEVRPGDLLFSRKNTRDLVAASALVVETREKLLLPDLIFRFLLKKDAPISKSFLHQLLITPSKRRAIQNLAGGSAGSMPNISKGNLLRVPIEVPPLQLQKRYENIAANIWRSRKQMEMIQSLHEHSLQSLQHRAFRGEL